MARRAASSFMVAAALAGQAGLRADCLRDLITLVCCSEAGPGEEEWPAPPAPPQWLRGWGGVWPQPGRAWAAEQAETGPHGAWAGESGCLGTAQPPPPSPFGPYWPSLVLAELKLSTLGLLQLPGHPSVPKGPTTTADPTWPSRPPLVQDLISGIETLLLEPPIAITSQFTLKSTPCAAFQGPACPSRLLLGRGSRAPHALLALAPYQPTPVSPAPPLGLFYNMQL